LCVDGVLDTEEIVAKPMHPILKSVGIYSGSTILGDGGVAMILSADGIGRYAGLSGRAPRHAESQIPVRRTDEAQRLLLLRYGPDELLALPVGAVKRVLMVKSDAVRQIAGQDVVDVDGEVVKLIKADEYLPVSKTVESNERHNSHRFVVLPRRENTSCALLVNEVLGTVDRPVRLDTRAIAGDGVLGTAIIDDRPALLLDFHRLLDRAANINALPPADGIPKRASRILVVDDTQFFRQIESTYLQQAGYDVTTAIDGRDAIDKHESQGPFDLIISDLEMPRLDGFGLARSIRASGFEGPMLSCSTLSSDDSVERAKLSGYDQHIVKLDRDEFVRTVGVLLQLKRQNVRGKIGQETK